jgi:hypothetical protein
MAAYRLTASGVTRTADGAHIPNDTRNRDWNAYLDWVALGNTADPITVPGLSAYKLGAIARIAREAESRRQAAAVVGHVDQLRFVEARIAVGDVTPTSGEYPLLNAQAVATSSTIAAVATAVVAEEAAVRLAWAGIEQAYRAGVVAINAAGSNGAVDTAVAAISWP